MTSPVTRGVHHMGLAVSRLEESAAFFTALLGWTEVHRDDARHAIFVNDGTMTITLWGIQGDDPTPFDRTRNVGLHHLALKVPTEDALRDLHQRLERSGVPIEFAPDLLGSGPAMQFMCYEPSGIRVEFTWPGK